MDWWRERGRLLGRWGRHRLLGFGAFVAFVAFWFVGVCMRIWEV